MITEVMNRSISILCKAYAIKGKRPKYINLWSMRKIGVWLLSHDVPMEKIDILLDIYITVRFR